MARTPGTLDITEAAFPTKQADTNQLTRGGNTVQREVVSIGSPEIGEEENILRPMLTGEMPVVGPLTNTELRAVPVPVSGTVATGGLTDVQLRATPVPVSGTVTASGPLTDTQLRASAVPISAASLPLPTGASTEATLALIKAKTDNLDVALSTRTKPADIQKIDGSAVVQPVSGTVTSNAGTGTRDVQGNVAHGAADSGNPVKVGGAASDTGPVAVANNNRVNAYFDRQGRQIVRLWGGSPWSQVHFPAVNTRATTTKSAGGPGNRNVCTGLTVILAGGATTPAAVQLDVRLRDGVADTGTILWQGVITLPSTAGAMNGITRSVLHIMGTANTAMTLEFSAAGGGNTFESVSMEGYTIVEA